MEPTINDTHIHTMSNDDIQTREKKNAIRRAWRAKNVDKIREQQRAWCAANPDKVKAKKQKYRSTHREKEREDSRQYHKANAAKVSARHARHYAQNRGRISVVKKAWSAANPDKCRLYANKHRAAKLGASQEMAALIAEWEQSWRAKRSARCYWCNKAHAPSKCHTEHIKPLSKGGPHSIENLCVSCAKCNLSKGAKALERWNAALNEPSLMLD